MMVDLSDEGILAYWGRERLVRWPEESLRQLRVPEATKRFLAGVGLPPGGGVYPRFRVEHPLKRMFIWPNCVRIGYRETAVPKRVYFCLDEDGEGRAVEVDDQSNRPPTLLNSSVQQLAGFLTLGSGVPWQTSGRAVARQLHDLGRQLRDVDPEAMKPREEWWSWNPYWLRLIEDWRTELYLPEEWEEAAGE